MFGHNFETVAALTAYCTCSISMILLNKLVIDTYKIDFPMGLLLMQNTSAVILVVTAKYMGWIHYPDFDQRVAKRWLPLTILFVAMLWTSMKSLRTMSVAVQTIVKNIAIVFTALGDSYFFGKQLNAYMFGAFGVMILGSYLGSASDPWVTAWGMFWTLANVAATVSYVLYMNDLLKNVGAEIGRYGPVFYNNLLSLPFLFVPSVYTLLPMMDAMSEAPLGGIMCLIGMILAGTVITFATFWCMRATSPTTYSVTGALNKIPLSVLGIVIFGTFPTTWGWVGIFFALSGGVWYAWLNRPKPKPPVVDVEEPSPASPQDGDPLKQTPTQRI